MQAEENHEFTKCIMNSPVCECAQFHRNTATFAFNFIYAQIKACNTYTSSAESMHVHVQPYSHGKVMAARPGDATACTHRHCTKHAEEGFGTLLPARRARHRRLLPLESTPGATIGTALQAAAAAACCLPGKKRCSNKEELGMEAKKERQKRAKHMPLI
jgi:hypothetical protein